MKYFTLIYTFYEGHKHLNDYLLFVNDYDNEVSETHKITTAERAMCFLRLMEKKSGQVAQLEVNRYESLICRKELRVCVK